MAEHDADREPEEKDAPPGEEQGPSFDEEQGPSFDEAEAWAAIVAGYGEEPPDPPGAKPFKSVEDLAFLESGTNGTHEADSERPGDTKEKPRGSEGDTAADKGDTGADKKAADKVGDRKVGDEPAAEKPLGSSVAFPPGVAGPRDHQAPEPSEEDFDADDEGHFVPPEPPPLPAAGTTAKFAWLAVLGGPLLLLLAVLLGWHMTWWLATLGIGGFVGGFGTLVLRMRTEDEDDEDPGRGAVV